MSLAVSGHFQDIYPHGVDDGLCCLAVAKSAVVKVVKAVVRSVGGAHDSAGNWSHWGPRGRRQG